jgi:hypothetical protein
VEAFGFVGVRWKSRAGLDIRSGVTALSKRGRVSNAERERRGKLNDRVSRSKGEKVVWWARLARRGEKFQF